MAVAAPSIVQSALLRIAGGELSALKPGQVLEALVLGTGTDGLTTLKAGDLLLKAALPQPVPPGTTLQLKVTAGGSAPQLAIVGRAPVASQPVVMPLPPAPVGTNVAQGVAPAPPRAVTERVADGQATAPKAAVGQEPPAQGARVSASVPQPQIAAAQTRGTAMRVGPSAVTAPRLVQTEAVAVAPNANGAPRLPLAEPATVAVRAPGSIGPPQAMGAVKADVPMPSAPAPPPNAAPAVGAGHEFARPAAASATPSPSAAPAVEATVATFKAPVAAAEPASAKEARVPPSPAQPNAAPSSAGNPALTVPRQAIPGSVSQSLPAMASAQPEAAAASPLLVAQAAPKAAPTIADMPKAPISQLATGPQATQRAPVTPHSLLAQVAAGALAKQDSLGPLLVSLAALAARSVAMPEPVVRAAQQVLGQRVLLNGAPSGEALKLAVEGSGTFLEAALARGSAPAADTKAALSSLKSALGSWLGGEPAAFTPTDRADPPLRGVPARTAPAEAPPLPDSPRELGRLLHAQTDAALSRVKLLQIASLPDAAAATPRGDAPALRMELPFLIGHELVMAHLQVERDGRRRDHGAKRAWTMRFAMTLSGTGEVGADVGVLGETVNVALWAAEEATAERLNAMLPELARALEAAGLRPGSVRCRPRPPLSAAAPHGHILDAVS